MILTAPKRTTSLLAGNMIETSISDKSLWKYPIESYPMSVNFANRLATGNTIASVAIQALDSLGYDVTAFLINNLAFVSPVVSWNWAAFGSVGNFYNVTITATDNQGSELSYAITLGIHGTKLIPVQGQTESVMTVTEYKPTDLVIKDSSNRTLALVLVGNDFTLRAFTIGNLLFLEWMFTVTMQGSTPEIFVTLPNALNPAGGNANNPSAGGDDFQAFFQNKDSYDLPHVDSPIATNGPVLLTINPAAGGNYSIGPVSFFGHMFYKQGNIS